MTISIYAPSYDPYEGYGRIALELAWHLTAAGEHVNSLGSPLLDFDTHTDAMRNILHKPIQASAGGLLLGYPTLYNDYGTLAGTGRRVAITMFESTRLPDGWVNALNQCDEVIVPARWLVDVMRQNGVCVPVSYTPLGVSETFTLPHMLPDDCVVNYPMKRFMVNGKLRYVREVNRPSAHNPFIFLCWGDRGERKGWDVAVKAFKRAFGDDPRVRLLIKARDGGMAFDIDIPGVEIVRADLDEAELYDLYLRCDAMVFPSRGEGFGLPPREFAATGGPAIATKWWADDITQWGYPLKYQMEPAWCEHPRFEGLGEWAEPDEGHLAQLMGHVFNQNPRVLAQMGQRAAGKIQRLYRWETFVNQVQGVWQHARSK